MLMRPPLTGAAQSPKNTKEEILGNSLGFTTSSVVLWYYEALWAGVLARLGELVLQLLLLSVQLQERV